MANKTREIAKRVFRRWEKLSLMPSSLNVGTGKVFLEFKAPIIDIINCNTMCNTMVQDMGDVYAIASGTLKVMDETGRVLGIYPLNPKAATPSGPRLVNEGDIDIYVRGEGYRKFKARLWRDISCFSVELKGLSEPFDVSKLEVEYQLYPDKNGCHQPLMGFAWFKYDGQRINPRDIFWRNVMEEVAEVWKWAIGDSVSGEKVNKSQG